MNTDYEMSVRREYAVLTPIHHVTVLTTGPVMVHESFDVRGAANFAAAAEKGMQTLRAKGYRLTGPVEQHADYATAHLARDEAQAVTVVLAGDLMQDARQVVKALSAIETREGAKEIVRIVADLMANALAIKAKAEAVLSSDKDVEAAAILDDVVTEVER